MFSGEYAHTMDDKGRVCLPAQHTPELGESLVLCRGLDGQVNIFPEEIWQRSLSELGKGDWADPSIRNACRIAFSASQCEVDRQGRILIPPWLRAHAGLDTNIVILGVNDHLEIWSPERWNGLLGSLQEPGSPIGEQLSGLGMKL